MSNKLKRAVKNLVSEERGAALILTMVLLVVGSLIIAPLLSYMGTSLKTGQMYERKTYELYSADAGVQKALWYLNFGGLEIAEDDPPYDLTPFSLNSKDVTVSLDNVDDPVHKITSIATSSDGSQTVIVSHVDIRSMLDNAITSYLDIEIGNNSQITGDIQSGNPPDYNPDQVTIDGEIIPGGIDNWPDTQDVIEYYELLILPPYDLDELDLADEVDDLLIDPMRRVGDLTIKNTGGPITVELTGCIHVTGNLDFPQPGEPRAYTIDLNGQTIFAEGNINFAGHRITLTGSGCIVALGDINFQPTITVTPDSFVFVMSVEGTTNFQPSGDFYGSVAGNVEVDLQPNQQLTNPGVPEGFAPILPDVLLGIFRILTWEISTPSA